MLGSRTMLLQSSLMLGTLLIAGCKQYVIEVELTPDGGGTRTIELSMTSIGEKRYEPTIDELRRLFWVTDEAGWKLEWQEGEDGEKTPLFTKTAKTPTVSGWREMSGDLRISGTLESDSPHQAEFTNVIRAERETTKAGTAFTYRETLTWSGLQEAAVDFLVDRFWYELKPAFPDLGETESAELRGLLAGYVSTRLQLFFEDQDDDDGPRQELVTLAQEAKTIIEGEYQEVQLWTIYDILEWVLKDTGDVTTRFLEKELPGVHLASYTDLVLKVAMPGEIVDTNADEIKGGRAIWNRGILDALWEPVEFYVRSKTES